MRKAKPITLPELVNLNGGAALSRQVGCHKSLPCLWAKGRVPSPGNIAKLNQIARDMGYQLNLQSLFQGVTR